MNLMFGTLKIFEIKKLKKFLFSFDFAKKTIGTIILFTMIFGIMAPAGVFAYSVYKPIGFTFVDFIRDKLAGSAAKDIFDGMIGVCGATLVGLTSMPLSLSQSALGWVTSDDFINVSFTGGKKGDANYNMVVDEGWKIVRNLVNMLIVLSFVIVAIATILGIQEYNAQKLLPLLIAIALLINFTPVICGLMIDASNITMNHFLSGATLDRGFVETALYQSNEVMSAEGLEPMQKAGLAFVFAGFNLIGTIIFGLFALLFAVRYIALWILVILSPLAFFCYIFPKARGVWSAWWTQFFQWCIIGIPAAFFIYLSNILIAQMSKAEGSVVSSPTGDISTSGFSSLFMFMIPLAFMVVGLFASFKTGAMGATMITSFAQTTGKKHVKWAGGKAKNIVSGAAFVKGTKEKMGRIGGGISKYTRPTKRGGALADAENIEKRDKGVEEDAKRMKLLSKDARNIAARTDLEKAGKFRANADQDMLEDSDKKNIDIVRRYGTPKDISDAEKKRLDWAGDFADKKDIEKTKTKYKVKTDEEAKKIIVREKVQGRNPLELRRDTQAETFKDRNVVYSMSETQTKEMVNKGKGKQKLEIYKTQARELETMLGLDSGMLEKNTGEEMKDSFSGHLPEMQRKIHNLENGNLEEKAKAKQMREINKAIKNRKF